MAMLSFLTAEFIQPTTPVDLQPLLPTILLRVGELGAAGLGVEVLVPTGGLSAPTSQTMPCSFSEFVDHCRTAVQSLPNVLTSQSPTAWSRIQST